MWNRHKPYLSLSPHLGLSSLCTLPEGSQVRARLHKYYFIRYHKGTRGRIFYHSKVQEVSVNTYARYIEDDVEVQNILDSSNVLQEVL